LPVSTAWRAARALGRSILYRGEHATRQEQLDAPLAAPVGRSRRVPVDVPSLALNRWNMRVANELNYRRGKPGCAFLSYDTYFYPLDPLLDWNRLYGLAGVCPVSVRHSPRCRAEIRAILARVSAQGSRSLPAVLKLFGAEGDGFLSFPLEGYTLALDFPVNAAVLNLMLELDAVVAEAPST